MERKIISETKGEKMFEKAEMVISDKEPANQKLESEECSLDFYIRNLRKHVDEVKFRSRWRC